LWARAAGMCSHPDCKKRLLLEASGSDEAAKIGESAHIIAAMPAGPRGDSEVGNRELNGYENLILLCPNCHATVDKQPDLYMVEKLRTWKAEHEAWVRTVTEPMGRGLPWTAVVQQEFQRADVAEAKAALGAGHFFEAVTELRTSPPRSGWKTAARVEQTAVEEMLARVPPDRRRFAVFSFGRIPMAVQLGYLLGDRARVRLFHYDRDRGTWAWPESEREGGEVLAPRMTETGTSGGEGAAQIRVSLSARVAAADAAAVAEAALDIEIAADEPSVRWLRWPDQLTELSRAYEKALEMIREHGRYGRVHLFYAGPAAGAVCFGRAYNPRMNPGLVLYEHTAGGNPVYERVLTLNVE
jgi:hypothetical protein